MYDWCLMPSDAAERRLKNQNKVSGDVSEVPAPFVTSQRAAFPGHCHSQPDGLDSGDNFLICLACGASKEIHLLCRPFVLTASVFSSQLSRRRLTREADLSSVLQCDLTHSSSPKKMLSCFNTYTIQTQ